MFVAVFCFGPNICDMEQIKMCDLILCKAPLVQQVSVQSGPVGASSGYPPVSAPWRRRWQPCNRRAGWQELYPNLCSQHKLSHSDKVHSKVATRDINFGISIKGVLKETEWQSETWLVAGKNLI